jgi:hypothetical protein
MGYEQRDIVRLFLSQGMVLGFLGGIMGMTMGTLVCFYLQTIQIGSAGIIQVDHVLIALPSYSVSESLMSHYGDRIPSLEHRYLGAILIPSRIPSCEVVYISTRRPEQAAIDYYPALLSPERRALTDSRIKIMEWNDGTPRSVAAQLVDRPDLVAELRDHIGNRPALIEPWNVTEHEVALALALGVPINGTRPELRGLGFKSAGRRLFTEAGVPVPLGREDVRTVDDVVAAILAICAEHPAAPGVVIKHDDSGAGDGNVVVDLGPMAAASDPASWLRATIEALPEWYRRDLALGGIVEERIVGTRFTSPSAQADIRPSGEVIVLATHEQVLGGEVGIGLLQPGERGGHVRVAGRQHRSPLVGAQTGPTLAGLLVHGHRQPAGAQEQGIGVWLVGPEETLRAELAQHDTTGLDLEIIHTDEVIGMDEHPAEAVRSRRRNTMTLCHELVRDGKALGAVSAGNSGAMMASALLTLRPRGPSLAWDDGPAAPGSAAVQLAFRVPPHAVDACHAELVAKGVPIVRAPTDLPDWRHRTLFFRDPEDNVVEIYAEY